MDQDRHFGLKQMYRLFANGWIVDGRCGGLLVGRTHANGHIVMVTPAGKGFAFCGIVSSGEYIMGQQSTKAHFERLHAINEDKSPCGLPITVSMESRIINTSAEPHDKLLLVSEQFIINENATKRHFAELEKLNNQYAGTYGAVFSDDARAIIESFTGD